jgi:hypothetical protein
MSAILLALARSVPSVSDVVVKPGRSNGLARPSSLPRTRSGRPTLRVVIAMDGPGPPSLALIHRSA